MLVMTEEFDRYSAKKLKKSGIIKGRIFKPIRSFSLHGGFSGKATDWSGECVSDVEPMIVYLTLLCSSPDRLPFVIKSLSKRA